MTTSILSDNVPVSRNQGCVFDAQYVRGAGSLSSLPFCDIMHGPEEMGVRSKPKDTGCGGDTGKAPPSIY